MAIGNSVTSIGNGAFYKCTGLTSVTIGDSVTTIGDYAFKYCTSLTSVTIGNGVTSIGEDAFYGCDSLTSVSIPDSVTTIGGDAFYICTSLRSVAIGNSVTSIGEYAFYACDSLTSVTIPNSVTSIGGGAFEGCTNLTSVAIGNSVTSIDEYAFYGCDSLTSVTIPDSVTTIGDDAFLSCDSLTGIWVSNANTKYASDECGVLFNKNKTTLIQCPDAYSGSYTIPDSVTTIGDSAFCECDSLTSVTIPDSVTTIGSSAFYNCTSLTGVYISDLAAWCSIVFSKSYYSQPFCYANMLYINGVLATDITIPDSITTIGDWAFYNCDSLTSVAIPDSVTSIGEDAFRDCFSLRSVTIPNSVTSIGYAAFSSCTSLTSVTIPDSVTSIGERALSYCDSLTSVTILNPDCSIYASSYTLGSSSKTTIYGYVGSTAQAYAEKYGYAFCIMCEAHDLSYIPATESTCLETGNIAHWYCTACCLCFSDADATQVVEPELPAAHSFDANGKCTVCAYSGQLVVEMTDSYGDSWNGNQILVYEDDVLIGELTVASGSSATKSIDYYSDREYRFEWKKGSYASECSFTILLNEDVLYEISGAGNLTDGETLLTIDAVIENTEPQLDANLKFNMNIAVGAEMVVNYNFMASTVSKYEDFYLEVKKNVEGGEPIITTYGISEGHTQMGVMNHPTTGEALLYNASYNGINAKEMGDTFETTLYAIDANGKVYKGETVVSSIKEFLMGKLDDAKSSAELKTMAANMLIYGAVAQVKFDYNTGDLVTNSMTAEHRAYATRTVPEATDNYSVTGDGANISTSITVGSKVELSLSAIARDVTDPTSVKCIITDSDDKVLAVLATGCMADVMFTAKYDNVGAREMRKIIKVTFYEGDKPISRTINWSVESYVAQMRADPKSSEADIALVDTMLNYGDSVTAYLDASGL